MAVSAAATVALNTVGGEIGGVPASLALLDDYGDRTASARVRGLVAVVKAQVLGDPEGTVARLESIAQESDREAAAVARLWAAHHLENSGDPTGAIAQADLALALVSDADGPWIAAMLHTMVGTLQSQLGDTEEAVRHARAALPVLDRLDAADDAAQTRSLLAVHAMSVGRLDEAEEWMAEIERTRRRSSDFGGASLAAARAEMALARGQVAEGLVLYRAAVDELKAIRFPGMGDATGLEPWALFGESLGVTALAVHGTTPEDLADGRALYLALLAKSDLVLDPNRPFMDYPVAGLVLHGLGAWGLLRERCRPTPPCCCSCWPSGSATPGSRPRCGPSAPTAAAEARAPGLAARLRADFAGRTAPSLLPEARAAIATGARGRCGRLTAAAPGDRACRVLHLARVGAHGERQEDRDDRGAAAQRPARPRWSRRRRPSSAHRGDDVADRVDLDEGLQPARQGVGGHEGVGQEGQREHDHHRDALHGLGAARRRCRTR